MPHATEQAKPVLAIELLDAGFQFRGVTGRSNAGFWARSRQAIVLVTADGDIYSRHTGDENEALLKLIEGTCPNGQVDRFTSSFPNRFLGEIT